MIIVVVSALLVRGVSCRHLIKHAALHVESLARLLRVGHLLLTIRAGVKV